MGPKYPVVDPAPSLDAVTANFGFGEYFTWFGVTALSLPLGYAAGKPFRGPSAVGFGLTGFIAGYLLAAQSSWGRLTGYLPNDSEVARYGARTTPVAVTAYSLSRKEQEQAPMPEKRRWWA